MIEPEGLTPFDTPGYPVSLTLSSFEESEALVSIGGVQIKSESEGLIARNGRQGKAGFIISANVDESLQHIKNFTVLLELMLGKTALLCLQCAEAVDIIEESAADVRTLQTTHRFLAAKILWILHLKTQSFLKSCSEAEISNDVDASLLEWDSLLQKAG